MNKLRTRPDLLIAFMIALIAFVLIAILIASQSGALPYVKGY